MSCCKTATRLPNDVWCGRSCTCCNGILVIFYNGCMLCLCTDDCQESMSQHDKRDMPIPADEATDFVLSKPESFAGFKIILNTPPSPNRLHHLLECCPRWSEDEIIRLVF